MSNPSLHLVAKNLWGLVMLMAGGASVVVLIAGIG